MWFLWLYSGLKRPRICVIRARVGAAPFLRIRPRFALIPPLIPALHPFSIRFPVRVLAVFAPFNGAAAHRVLSCKGKAPPANSRANASSMISFARPLLVSLCASSFYPFYGYARRVQMPIIA